MTTSRGRRVLVDTAAFFALADANDQRHREARSIASRLGADRVRQFTTNFILAEVHALALARLGRAAARTILDRLDRSAVVIVRVTPTDERRARQILASYQDKDFSLTDALSFAVMERLEIDTAFTFDHHFAQFSFRLAGF